MMIKIWIISWIILGTILSIFPLGYGLYFLYRFSAKYIVQFFATLRNKKMMYKIKEELVDNNIIEEELQEFHEEESSLDDEQDLLSVPDYVWSNESLEQIEDINEIVSDHHIDHHSQSSDDVEQPLEDSIEDKEFLKKRKKDIEKIVEVDPTDHKAIWQIGEMYLISWDFETAELLVEKAISLNQSNPKYYISMVEILYNTDRKMQAVEIMEKVVKLRPTNTVYLLTLADLFFEIHNLDAAKKNYFRVLEYEPTNEKAKAKLKSLS